MTPNLLKKEMNHAERITFVITDLWVRIFFRTSGKGVSCGTRWSCHDAAVGEKLGHMSTLKVT